jgi:hypothetical protein
MGSKLSGVGAVVPGAKMEGAIAEGDRRKRRETERAREKPREPENFGMRGNQGPGGMGGCEKNDVSLREPKNFRLLVGSLNAKLRSRVRMDSRAEIVFIIIYRSTKGVT